MRMNLTWAQVGGILKYTRPAWWRGETPETHHYLMKKPGYYLSEEAYIARLRKELNLALYSRFPLTWIMEAADDISYCVADLEDAVEKEYLPLSSFIIICTKRGASMRKVRSFRWWLKMPGKITLK